MIDKHFFEQIFRKAEAEGFLYDFLDSGDPLYCNHVIAPLLEIAEDSLYELKEIPIEKAFTSKARRYGVPSEKIFPKSL